MTDYGAFVELEEGVEGLVHISDKMSWTQRVKHPSKVVAIGDAVEVVVLDVDRSNKRISLGMRQAEPNPWNFIEERYPVGTRVEGRVRNLADFGAFVELEEGIDGLIHISDMSWTKRYPAPVGAAEEGREGGSNIVLHVDKANHRISLGLKQVQQDPWQAAVPDKYRVGMDVGFMTMAACLTTGPATLAGNLVVGNAEVISATAHPVGLPWSAGVLRCSPNRFRSAHRRLYRRRTRGFPLWRGGQHPGRFL